MSGDNQVLFFSKSNISIVKNLPYIIYCCVKCCYHSTFIRIIKEYHFVLFFVGWQMTQDSSRVHDRDFPNCGCEFNPTYLYEATAFQYIGLSDRLSAHPTIWGWAEIEQDYINKLCQDLPASSAKLKLEGQENKQATSWGWAVVWGPNKNWYWLHGFIFLNKNRTWINKNRWKIVEWINKNRWKIVE